MLHPTAGSKVGGTVTFTEVADGVQVHADLTGLGPGNHGFHVHEFGDCSAPDAMSAGGHFNPTNEPHAGPDDAARHVGDMGNVDQPSTKRHWSMWTTTCRAKDANRSSDAPYPCETRRFKNAADR